MEIGKLLSDMRDDNNCSNEIVRARAIYVFAQAVCRDLVKSNNLDAIKIVEERLETCLESI